VRLLVFGAGGRIGGRIVAEAAGRGHAVTAVHRGAPAVVPAGVDTVRGDVRDPLALLRRERPDVVVSAVGAAPLSAAPDLAVYADAAQALVDAVRALGEPAPRLVAVGGAGSLRAEGGVPLVDTPGFPAEFRAEALAQARALDVYRAADDVRWTYVSPAAVIEPGERTGRFRTGGDELLIDEHGSSCITIEDFAVAVLEEVQRPAAIRARMTVAY
jgi:uncharacterized protein